MNNKTIITNFLQGATKGQTPTRTILNGVDEYNGKT